MITTTLTTMALIGLSSAQSTVSLFIPDGVDNQSLVGSVVGSVRLPNFLHQPFLTLNLQSGSITTYVIQCPPGIDSTNCGFPEPVTVVGGPSTVHLAIGVQDLYISISPLCGSPANRK